MRRVEHPLPITASRRVERALEIGQLTRLDHCEVCGKTEAEIRAGIVAQRGHTNEKRSVILAHHWNGYDNSLDVWWLCPECNSTLHHRHDGSLTLEDARRLIRNQYQIEVKEIVLAGGRVFNTGWLAQILGADFSKA